MKDDRSWSGVGDERPGSALCCRDGLLEPVDLEQVGLEELGRAVVPGRDVAQVGGALADPLAAATRRRGRLQPIPSVWATRRSAIARMSTPCSRSWAARLRITSVSPYMGHRPSEVCGWSPVAFPVGRPRNARATTAHGCRGDLEDLRRGAGRTRSGGGQEAVLVEAGELVADSGIGRGVDGRGPGDVVVVVVVVDDPGPVVVEGHRHLLDRVGVVGAVEQRHHVALVLQREHVAAAGKPSTWAVGDPAVTTSVTLKSLPWLRIAAASMPPCEWPTSSTGSSGRMPAWRIASRMPCW